MKKILLFIGLMFVTNPAHTAEMKPLASLPNAGYFYYYSPDFDIDTYQKPAEIHTEYGNYTLFIYDRLVNKDNFIYYQNEDHQLIEDDSSEMFSLIINGIESKPTYYVYREIYNGNEPIEEYICKFEPNNKQIRYIRDNETGRFVKQLEFNNGELSLPSICNPDYNPTHDV